MVNHEKIKNSILKMLNFFIIFIFILQIYFIEYKRYDSIVMTTNFLIILISLFFMFTGDKHNYSLNKIFYLFTFFFFGIAPGIEYLLNVRYWKGSELEAIQYVKMNTIIILILIFYQILYFIFSKFQTTILERKYIKYLEFGDKASNGIKLLIISIVALMILLYCNKFSIIGLLLRGGENIERLEVSKSLGLIIGNFIKPLPVVVLLVFKIKNIKNRYVEVLLILVLLLTNFPTSGARFYIAAIYIPLLITYLKTFRKKLFLNKFLIFGLLFIFPILDEMRRFESLGQLKLGFKFDMFLEGHFDSYQMFMRSVENNIITNGDQLLTAILFFVPRSLWTSKSIGSGAYVSEKIGLSFNNISMNYFGEGYINFGYFGIILFVFIIAFFNARLDNIYWKKAIKRKNLMNVIYLILLGMEFFILRGDLLSSFAFTVGIVFSSIFVFYNLK